MTLLTHGPGIPLDLHNGDSTAHSDLFGAKVNTADAAGPEIIVPPAAIWQATAVSAWYLANAATFMRFPVTFRKTYRYANLRIGAQSGNIQVGVGTVRRTAGAVYVTKVMDSGVIACPAASDQQIDLGATSLAPGDYMIWLWCDNTTAQFAYGATAGLTASRLVFGQTGFTSGVGSSEIQVATSTRWITGLILETA
jgi:hypothetical protein